MANTCPVSIASGTILTINANEIIGPLSGAGDVVLNADLVVNHAAAAPGITGVISGSGALAVVGSNTGALTLSGINTHTGGTRLGAGGTAVIGSTVALGATSAPLLFDGGRLRLNAHTNLTAAAVQTRP